MQVSARRGRSRRGCREAARPWGLGWGRGAQARGSVLNLGQRIQTFPGTCESGCQVEGGSGWQARRASGMGVQPAGGTSRGSGQKG